MLCRSILIHLIPDITRYYQNVPDIPAITTDLIQDGGKKKKDKKEDDKASHGMEHHEKNSHKFT